MIAGHSLELHVDASNHIAGFSGNWLHGSQVRSTKIPIGTEVNGMARL